MLAVLADEVSLAGRENIVGTQRPLDCRLLHSHAVAPCIVGELLYFDDSQVRFGSGSCLAVGHRHVLAKVHMREQFNNSLRQTSDRHSPGSIALTSECAPMPRVTDSSSLCFSRGSDAHCLSTWSGARLLRSCRSRPHLAAVWAGAAKRTDTAGVARAAI